MTDTKTGLCDNQSQTASVVYPCGPTMGAMMRFKKQTGKEVTELDGSSFSDLCTYLWCCVVSACSREGVPFGMGLLEMADCLSSEDLSKWRQSKGV